MTTDEKAEGVETVTTEEGAEVPLNVGMQVGVENGNIVVIFSEAISVLGLTVPGARQLARALYDNADIAEEMLRQMSRKPS